MFERMHTKGLPSHLVAIAGSSVVVGLLLSGFVLSASPSVGFAIVLVVGAGVVAATEAITKLRKKGRNRPTDPSPRPAHANRRREHSHRDEPNRDFVEAEAELIPDSWR